MGDEIQHEVTISKPFWIGDTPITQEFWEVVMSENPSRFDGLQNPVESVSGYDCTEFCSKLHGLFPELNFRLPSEAEWEFSCRAGTTEATYAESLGCSLDDIAWFHGNSNGQTHPVKKKLPNPWGLYDMLGNVSEWCSPSTEESARPVVPLEQFIRGGSCNNSAERMRATYRYSLNPGSNGYHVGLRLVIDL
jgi:formylglycine-generating enzyme required for sulfatase activity